MNACMYRKFSREYKVVLSGPGLRNLIERWAIGPITYGNHVGFNRIQKYVHKIFCNVNSLI